MGVTGNHARGIKLRVPLLAVASAAALVATSPLSAVGAHTYIGRSSIGAINGNGAYDAVFVGVSADASKVFFETSEQLEAGDTDTKTDVYQRSGGVTSRLSAGAINGNGADDADFEE